MDTSPSQEPLFPERPSPPPQPVAPEPPSALPAPVPEEANRLEPRRFIAPVLAALAAVLTLIGGFLPLFEIRPQFGQGFLSSQNEGALLTVTAWRTQFYLPGQEVQDQPSAPLGAPLLLAAALFLAAVVAGVIYASRRAEGVVARGLTLAGAVFLPGIVLTIGMVGLGTSVRDDSDATATSIGSGLWLLILATLIAVAAVVVSALRTREPAPAWADPAVAFADTATPPSGIPVQTAEVAITLLPPELPPTDPWAPRRDDG